MSAPPLLPRLGVSVCVWKGDSLLLIRRAKPPHAGLWSPVGGMVEWGETLETAARREVREETALDITLHGLVGNRDLIVTDAGGAVVAHIVLAVFAATWRAGEPVAGDDADRACWVVPAALAGFDLVPGVLPWIERARAGLDAPQFHATPGLPR